MEREISIAFCCQGREVERELSIAFRCSDEASCDGCVKRACERILLLHSDQVTVKYCEMAQNWSEAYFVDAWASRTCSGLREDMHSEASWRSMVGRIDSWFHDLVYAKTWNLEERKLEMDSWR